MIAVPQGMAVYAFYGGTAYGNPTFTTSAVLVSAASGLDTPSECYVYCCTAAGAANSVPILVGPAGQEVVPLTGSTSPYHFKGVSPSSLSFKAQASPAASDQVTFVFVRHVGARPFYEGYPSGTVPR